MTNIPDDILEKARGLVDNYGCDPDGLLVGAIAAAIQSERETMAIAFEANLNEMSQRFRAVNIAEVINQSGVDFVKLSERLAASEARVAELEAALKEQLAFHAMDLTLLRGHAPESRIADIEFRRDRIRAALTPAKENTDK